MYPASTAHAEAASIVEEFGSLMIGKTVISC